MIEDISIQLSRLPSVPNGVVGLDFISKVYNGKTDDDSINQLFERLKSILSKIIQSVNSVKDGKTSSNEKQLEEKLKALNIEYREIKDEYNSLHEQLKDSNKKLEELKQKLDEKQEEYVDTYKKVERISLENEELRSASPCSTPLSPFRTPTRVFSSSALDSLPANAQVDDVRQALLKREEELQEYAQKYSKEYGINERHKVKIEELELKIKNVTAELDYYKDHVQKEKLRVEQFYNQYNQEVEKNKANIKALEETYNTFKEKIKQDILEMKKENKNLKDNLEKVTKEKSEHHLVKQNEQLLQKKKEQTEKYNKLVARYERAKASAEELRVYKQDKEEIVRQLNMYKKRNEELSKLAADHKESKESSSQPKEPETEISLLKAEIIKWKEQSEMFESSLNDTTQCYEKLLQEKEDIAKRVDRAEEQRLESMKEKAKLEKNVESMKEEMKRLSDVCTEHEKIKKQYDEKIVTLNNEKTMLSEIVEKGKLEETQYKRIIDHQRQVLENSKQSVQSLSTELEQSKAKNNQLLQDLEKKETECHKQTLSIKKLESEKQRFLEKEKTLTASSSTDTSFRCSQCNENDIDTVISRCFHCFCKTCLDKNIKIRNRKCPRCGMRYDPNDVKTLYF